MSLIITLYPQHEEEVFTKSRRNLDLKIKRFCIENEKVVIRAVIKVHRDYKCKTMRKWTPVGHILLIHNSDYEKWTGIVRKKFKDFQIRIEVVINYDG